MSAAEPQQVFVRNDKGRLWGPITLPTLELLLDNGLIDGRIQVSKDGVNFAFPGRFPDIREFVPPELWGEGAPPPGATAATAAARPAAGPAPGVPAASAPGGSPRAAPTAGPGAPPLAGPGTAPVAGHGAAPMAGPGAAPAAGPGVSARPVAPGVPVAGPGAQAAVLRAGPGAVSAAQQPRAVPQGGARTVTGAGIPAAGPGAAGASGAPRANVGGVAAAASATVTPSAPVAPSAPGPSPAAAASAGSPPSAATTASVSGPAEPPASGDLASTSPVRLYYLAASGDHTGLLTLRLSDRVVEIHFRKGNPEYIGSNHADDAIGGFLLRENLARPDQIAEAEAEQDRFGGDLVAALFGKGVLNPTNAFTHLAQRAQGILMKAMLATSGTFEYAPKEFPLAKTLPLGNRWSVLMELVRRIPAPELRRRLADVADNPVMKSGGQVAVSELRLTPQETRAIGYIDGVRSLNLLARDLPQDADAFFRLAWVLREMEIVSFAAVKLPNQPQPAAAAVPPAAAVTQQPKAAAAPAAGAAAATGAATPSGRPAAPAAAAPASAPRPGAAPAAGPVAKSPTSAAKPAAPASAPASRPTSSATAPAPGAPAAASAPASSSTAAGAAAPAAPINYAAELVTLRAAVAKLKDQNKFEVLGITDKADGSAVKLAYFKLAKTYHPDTIPLDAPPEYAKLKGEIFAAVGEAYRTLSDDKARAEYIEELKHGGAADIDVAQILHAEELFQKGCILVKAKKFPEAVEMLTEAIQSNPEEGEFYAWRGIARFFASTDKKQGQVEGDRDLQLALKKNPRCAQAYFFQGQMAKLLNDSKKALQQFQKTLELQPDHLDAQREIRYLKK